MVSEAEIIIAFLFKRSGKEELGVSEFYLPLSMDLKWFSPKDAKAFLKRALEQNLLMKKGDLFKPNFDYRNIVVPVGFHPTKQILNEKVTIVKKENEDVGGKIIDRVAEKTGLNKQEVIKRIKDVEKEKNIHFEVAALIIGREYDVYVEDCYEDVEEKVFRGNGE